ncbi:MAG: helix-turn-helix domain-containing protein, partial [Bacteroidetes bacterium]|nr:helix-turn-helix domain-containing protein [Bacteroidota bacterium]
MIKNRLALNSSLNVAYTPNIQALKKGDSQAFENLVDAYKNQILRLCLGFFSDYY